MFELNGVPVWMELLGWVLVHFLWEGAVIAFVAWAGLACMRRASAQARYLILCGALLACAIAPCATWALLAGGVRGSAGPIAISTGSETAMHAATSFMADGPLPGGNPGIWLRGSTPHPHTFFERLATAIQARLPHLVMLWGLGVIILSLRLIHGWIQLRALRASGTPATDQTWVRRLHALAERMGVRRAIRLLESARVEVPTVIGWLKPLLLLPVGFLAGLPPEQVEAILAHELAHIRRHDYFVNLLQIAIETLLFYHPAIWWLSATIRQERENCCDDIALQIAGDRVIYVTALAAIEESRSLPGAITMAAAGGSLLKRIRRLTRPAERGSGMGGILAAIGIVLLAGAAATIHRAHAKEQDAATDPFVDIDFTKVDQNDYDRYAMAYRDEVLDDHLEKAAAYLKHGMNVNPSVLAGGRDDILGDAAWFARDPAMIRLLLAHGAKCQGDGKNNNSTVNEALRTGNKEVADILIAAGGAYDPILYDAALGEIDDLKKQDASQPLKPDEAKRALGFAVDAGQIETFDWLWPKFHSAAGADDHKTLDRYYSKAAGSGRLPFMLHLEKMGVNPAISGPRALENAVAENHLPEAKHLFDLGVKLPVDPHGFATPLRDAAGDGHVEMMKLLLDHGADINAKDGEGMTSLCWAAYEQQNDACLLLIERGIDGNIADKYGRNAAFYTAAGNLPDALAALIKKGVKVDGRDKNGNTVTDYMNDFVIPRLGKVGFPGRVLWPDELNRYNANVQRTVSLLASAHVNLDASGPGGSAPGGNALDNALSGVGNYAMARALLANGATMSGDGHQELAEICDGGWDQPIPVDLLAELLKRGADPNLPAKGAPKPGDVDFGAAQPVIYAVFQKAARSHDDPPIESSTRDAMRILLAHGAAFAGNPGGGVKDALEAAALDDLPRLQAAVGKGTPVDCADSVGWTPLIVAMAMGNEDCIQWLLRQGADVKRMTKLNDSPLVFAVMRQEPDRVAAILAKGGGLTSLTIDGGNAALGWAVSRNDLPIFRLLIAAGARGSPDDIGEAIQEGDTEMVRTILNQGANADVPEPTENRGSVYWAVSHGEGEILKLLLDHGANPEMQTDYKETPLSEAQEFHKEFVPILQAAIARRHPHPAAPAASPSPARLGSVRERFIPGSIPTDDMGRTQGAAWESLSQGPVKGFLWLHAWAAVGNEFPVQNKAGAKLFSVRMADGNDDHVVLVIESKHQSQRIDVTRDKSAAVKVAGIEYQIDYPSAMVAAAGNPAPTTPKAMLIVSTQQP